jgi:serine protease inhibitor
MIFAKIRKRICAPTMPEEESAVNIFALFKSHRKFLLVISASLAAWQLVASPATDQQRLVSANTAFAFALMNRVAQAQPGANVFLSPFSVSSALQMAGNGAAGDTKSEMQQVLKTGGLSAASLNSACSNLDQQFAGRKDVTLSLANGLWYQHGFHLKPAFVEENKSFFQAKLAGVDFANPQSAKTINAWADEKTEGKIKELDQFPFPPLTRLILANAIYFKGEWVEPFKKSNTHPRDFHLPNGQSRPTPMMARTGYVVYQETPDFQAVELPYKGGLQMELFLPSTNSNPQKLLAAFAASGHWQKDIQSGFSHRDGSVILPKFKLESDLQLNESLKALGIKSAFAVDADFSGIADERMFISEVRQKSFVDVNEAGTEAAAVTTVRVTALATQLASPIAFVMLVDRPFLFMITDDPSGTILFMGIVNDPTGG